MSVAFRNVDVDAASPVDTWPYEALVTVIERTGRQAEARERAEVATEVGDLIAASGLSVTDLATRIGTSRSRLSTYRSGTVVPSVAMMNRLRRTVPTRTIVAMESTQGGYAGLLRTMLTLRDQTCRTPW